MSEFQKKEAGHLFVIKGLVDEMQAYTPQNT